jgi:hypothetical protein
MASADRSGTHRDVPTPPPTGDHTPSTTPGPWYAIIATSVGRPVVLGIALAMCAPGEYHLARLAGWSDPWALGMPAALSAYAGIAAVVAASRPKGARGRISAIAGATVAILLALAAQVVAHLISRGHMVGNQAWLIGLISAVPPAVVGHLLHLASTPVGRVGRGPAPRARLDHSTDVRTVIAAPASTQASAPVTAPAAPPLTPAVPPAPVGPPAITATAPPAEPPTRATYTNPSHEAIRRLYDTGTRPTTSLMRDAVAQAGGGFVSPGSLRTMRQAIELVEPELALYPAAINTAA